MIFFFVGYLNIWMVYVLITRIICYIDIYIMAGYVIYLFALICMTCKLYNAFSLAARLDSGVCMCIWFERMGWCMIGEAIFYYYFLVFIFFVCGVEGVEAKRSYMRREALKVHVVALGKKNSLILSAHWNALNLQVVNASPTFIIITLECRIS